MKLISWNVNGIRAVDRKGELDLLIKRENQLKNLHANDTRSKRKDGIAIPIIMTAYLSLLMQLARSSPLASTPQPINFQDLFIFVVETVYLVKK